MLSDILFSPVVTVTERITRSDLVQYNCFLFQSQKSVFGLYAG